jgi:hypothetical protein
MNMGNGFMVAIYITLANLKKIGNHIKRKNYYKALNLKT